MNIGISIVYDDDDDNDGDDHDDDLYLQRIK